MAKQWNFKEVAEVANASGMELKDEILVLLKGAGEKGLFETEVCQQINLSRTGAGNKVGIALVGSTLDEGVSEGMFLKVGERYVDPKAQTQPVPPKSTNQVAQTSALTRELETANAGLQRIEGLRGTDAKRIESLETRLRQTQIALELSCKDAQEAREAITTLESMLDVSKLETEGLKKQLAEAKAKPLARSEEMPLIVSTLATLNKLSLFEMVAVAIAAIVCVVTGWYALTF